MRRHHVERLVDGVAVGLVVAVLAFAATTPRASTGAPVRVAAVTVPPTACKSAPAEQRSACLALAKAIVLRP